MLRTYLVIAWRNILRHKINGFINITGLSLGLTCGILIAFYIKDELNFDRFFKDSDRIYRVNLNGKMGDDEFNAGHTPPPAGKTLAGNFPQIESFTRIYKPGDEVVSCESGPVKRSFTEKAMLSVDSNFLTFFDYSMKEGDPVSCLQDPYSVVLTETIARKYFGSSAVIGQYLFFDEWQQPFKVTAILKDLPSRSSLQFDILVPNSAMTLVKNFDWSWVWLQMSTYIKLKEHAGTSPEAIRKMEAKFPEMIKIHASSAFERIGKPFDEFRESGGRWDMYLQPLKDVHLRSTGISSAFIKTSDIKYVYIFFTVAVFIILLACVNFMNMATAQSAKRTREMGVRKVLGSSRKQLVRLFLVESLFCTLIALILALVLVFLLLPYFNGLAGKDLQFQMFFDEGIWVFTLLACLITGLLSGTYPALYMSAFSPVQVLKGIINGTSGKGNALVRNVLVVFQFTVSTALIVCTLIVLKQLRFMQDRDLGLHKESVLILPHAEKFGNDAETIRQEFLKLSGVKYAALSTSIPTQKSFGDFYVPQTAGNDLSQVKDIVLSSFMVDDSFVPALGIRLIQGRGFSKDFNDSLSIILNESAVKQIGWKKPIGKTIKYPGNNNQEFKVVGVVKDFNTESLHYAVAPFALFSYSSRTYHVSTAYLSVNVGNSELKPILRRMEDIWKRFGKDVPFEYSFLDSEFNSLYHSEQKIAAVFSVFTVLSIFIACIGLFGLAAYTAERRTKEIGIRKILGASVAALVAMLSKDFVKVIMLSTVIGCPLALLAMKLWLQDFAYQTEIAWYLFAGAALLTLIIALTTISFNTIKVALTNPVKSLRNE